MAGYSGTPLVRKLGIKPSHHVVLVDAPAEFDVPAALVDLPANVTLRQNLRGSAPVDLFVLFAPNRRDLDKRLPACERRLATAGGLWIAWPKKASGVHTDLSDSVVRERGLATGLVDNKTCAIDDVWSGLRFVRRLTDR